MGSEFLALLVLLTVATVMGQAYVRGYEPSYAWWAVPGWIFCLLPLSIALVFPFQVSTSVGSVLMRLTEIMFYSVPAWGLTLLFIKPRQWFLTIPVAALQTAIALVCTFAIACSSGQGCL